MKPDEEPGDCGRASVHGCIVMQAEFKQVTMTLDALRVAIVGNPEMGQRGLVDRTKQNEQSLASLSSEVSSFRRDFDLYKERITGIVMGATFVGSGVGAAVTFILQTVIR